MASISQTYSCSSCQVLVLIPEDTQISNLPSFLNVTKSLAVPVLQCSESFMDEDIVENLILQLLKSAPMKLRPILYLCGAFLEEQISFVAHIMLETGFDTRLIRDLIVAKNADHARFHDQRLLHSGAKLATSKQLLYEWIATQQDIGSRSRLMKSLRSLE